MRISGNTFCRLLGVVAVCSCAVADPFIPSPENMAGAYSLRELVAADTQGISDWLAAGATLNLNLALDGTMSGHLFLPGGAPGGGDLDADMAGTWLLTGNVIQFGQAAQTFVRDIDYSAGPDRIVGDKTFGDSLRIIIALRK